MLSKSEKCFLEIVNQHGGVVSFYEIAGGLFSYNFSLPAVSVVFTRSPVSDKVESGLYKIRGKEISWEQIEACKRKTGKNFSK